MNQVTVFNPKSNVPAFARKGELSSIAKALMGGGAGGGKRISVKGGVFRLVVDGKEVQAIEDRHLDVVLVNAAPKIARTFYMTTFDENAVTAPDCWSADGDKPDPTAKNKQSDACATCPQNVKGSGQGDSKACRYSQRVAVVLANDMEGDVLQLSLAATSIFGKAEGENRPLQEYARWLAAQGVDPGALVTRLRFDTKAATPKLFFKPMRWLEEDEYAICQKQGQSDDALKAITMTVAQMDKAPEPAAQDEDAEPPPPPPKSKKAAPAPAPAAEPEEPAEEAPPVKRAAKPPAAVAPAKSSVADLVNQWDDE